MTILCIACYFKGSDFMVAAKELGCKVLVLTSKSLENESWPRESIDEMYYIDAKDDEWDMSDIIKGVNHLSRSIKIEKIIALDDFDVERAAHLREHLRIPGMGDTRARYFRDKLAMRMMALDCGINVPDFVGIFNDDEVKAFTERTPAPWMLKPRSQASATGIKKIESTEQLWEEIDKLGDDQGSYLLEQFLPGDVYHVDAINHNGEVKFARVHKYMNTPMEVAHEGGVFRTHTVGHGSNDDVLLQNMNRDVMKGFGMLYSASHTEFIKSHSDGEFYFLETSARVGGANIAELVEASSGVNLWKEWAKIEVLGKNEKYNLPHIRNDYSGIIISLAKQQHPDMSDYNNPEIVWKIEKDYHAGMIVCANNLERVTQLLEEFATRFYNDFTAVLPAPDKPTS